MTFAPNQIASNSKLSTKLLVVSHKTCWPSEESTVGYATDGGFAFQMSALSELFDETRLLVPCTTEPQATGQNPLSGHNIVVCPLQNPTGVGAIRKAKFLGWFATNFMTVWREVRAADIVHTPIPGDIGTIGMIFALVLRKPLFVRHCGNWFVQRTTAERFWKWFMERFAGGRNLMLATGGHCEPPSRRNANIRWIFSTTLAGHELARGSPRDGLQGNPIRLIIACRQEKEKGTSIVIESLPEILKHYPDSTLGVIGDGGALKEFQSLANTMGLAGHVTFHGKVNHQEVIELLKQADVFCYPTRASEGFPKVVLEALACGLPVITTPVSVLPQLIGNGCGLLLDKATPEALAEGVCALASDPDKYRQMSRRAIETASLFSLERWRDQIGSMLALTPEPLRSDA